MPDIHPKIAFVSVGGTIASIGLGPFDLLDYNATNIRVSAAEIVNRTGLQSMIAEVVPIDFKAIDSTAITFADWSDLAELCSDLADDPTMNGIVVGHGTASLEETAWALALVLNLRVGVVVTGAMRPLTGLSSDAASNLAASIRVAAEAPPGAVFVVMNDEIHDPRDVTKTHTLRLDAFQSPRMGAIGTLQGTSVNLRKVGGRSLPSFAPGLLREAPRVDVVYSYVGSDGIAIRAFVDAGAKGLVAAGFGPGLGTPNEAIALGEAVELGLIVVQSSRTGAGVVVDSLANQRLGLIAGNDLNPQKARVLLGLCLARGDDPRSIESTFKTV